MVFYTQRRGRHDHHCGKAPSCGQNLSIEFGFVVSSFLLGSGNQVPRLANDRPQTRARARALATIQLHSVQRGMCQPQNRTCWQLATLPSSMEVSYDRAKPSTPLAHSHGAFTHHTLPFFDSFKYRRTFAHLRGTSLRLYAVDMEDVPRLHVRNISLQMARCDIAADYKQRSNVIRIRACDRTILLECKDRIDTLTWLEHLQAAANIATSLEDRCMPKFYTLSRSQSSHSSNRSSSSNSSRTQTASSSNVSTTQQQQQQQQPQQQQQQPPTSTHASRQLQLQQQLQEHQEQILQQQRQEHLLQLQQRQQQMAVQPSESRLPLSPLTSRTSIMSTTASSNESRRANIRFGRRSSSSSSNSPSSPWSSDRRPDTSLMTRAQRARTMSDEDRRLEAMQFEDDSIMRSVLHALGNSRESEHVHEDSEDGDDDEEEDNEEDDGQGTDVDLGDTSSFQGGTRVPMRRHSSPLINEPLSSSSVGSRPNDRSRSSQESSRRNSTSHYQREGDSHDDEEHQQRGWNRSLRIFGHLWGHQHQHQHQPRHQRPLSLAS